MRKQDDVSAICYWREKSKEYLRLSKENKDTATAEVLKALAALYSRAVFEVDGAESERRPSYRRRSGM
jgi:hypothetical protein